MTQYTLIETIHDLEHTDRKEEFSAFSHLFSKDLCYSVLPMKKNNCAQFMYIVQYCTVMSLLSLMGMLSFDGSAQAVTIS